MSTQDEATTACLKNYPTQQDRDRWPDMAEAFLEGWALADARRADDAALMASADQADGSGNRADVVADLFGVDATRVIAAVRVYLSDAE